MIRVNFKPLGVPTFGHSLKMDVWDVAGSIGSSVINAISSNYQNAKQRNFAREMYLRQYQDSVNEWYRQAEYNSPENQKKLLQEAGLNPNLLMGNMSNVGSVDSTQMPSASGSYTPSVPHFNNPLAELAQIGLAQAQIDKTNAETNALNSQVNINTEMMYAKLRQMGVDFNLSDQLYQYNQSFMPKQLLGKDLENKSATLGLDLMQVKIDGEKIMNDLNSEDLRRKRAFNVYVDEEAAINIASQKQNLSNMVLQGKMYVANAAAMYAASAASYASANLSYAQQKSVEYDMEFKKQNQNTFVQSLKEDLRSKTIGNDKAQIELNKLSNSWQWEKYLQGDRQEGVTGYVYRTLDEVTRLSGHLIENVGSVVTKVFK